MSELTDKVLNELRDKDVRPVPAWRFVLNSALTWIGFGLFVLLGAQSVSIILFLLSDNDWSELGYFRGGPIGYAFTVLPYVWVAALVLLVTIAYLEFRKTKGGYRYRSFAVIGAVVALSMVAGVSLHSAGLGKRADAMFENHLPQYRRVVPRGIQIWDRPQAGRLVGEIENLGEDGSFDLVTPSGESWTVHPGKDHGGRMPPAFREGEPVRVVGEPSGDGGFDAKAVLPWGPGIEPSQRMHQLRHNGNLEESTDPARNTGEGQSRPSVHPAQPLGRQISQ